jgi:hypothetical protein
VVQRDLVELDECRGGVGSAQRRNAGGEVLDLLSGEMGAEGVEVAVDLVQVEASRDAVLLVGDERQASGFAPDVLSEFGDETT